MTDSTTIPPLAATMLASVCRAGLQGLAGVLIAHGAMQSGQSGEFVSIGLGIAASAAGVAWSWYQHRNAHKALQAAVAAPVATVVAGL